VKVVILAGGRGTRMGGDQPKPMVQIGGIPILSHIMGIYKKYGHSEFIIACGYKGDVIREHYAGDPNVTCLDTGRDSGDGERVWQCKQHIGSDPFLLTYGDGLADVNINKLIKHHNNLGSACTMTVVHQPVRFGKPVLDGFDVTDFTEKGVGNDWINGGFFVVTGEFPRENWLAYGVLPWLAQHNDLTAYYHAGFWQCMDTQRDVDYLNQLWSEGNAPWL